MEHIAEGGARIDLGHYVRSRAEANYERFLQFIIANNGDIITYDYEPETFEFKGIRRGTRFYTPDFKVTLRNGLIEYHEVKGYMDPKSATRLKRMAKYFPDVKIVVISSEFFRTLKKQGMDRMIPNWE